LASKTSLTKKFINSTHQQTGACDDPEGIPRGHTCILKPTPTHACFTGEVQLHCPSGSSDVEQYSKLKVGCQVCGASHTGDFDSRAGRLEVQIFWGPNTLDGFVNEEVIEGYAVFAAECRERQGDALATIPAKTNTRDKTQECCNHEMYQTTVQFQLPPGVTSKVFMVVPLTSIGPLDAGWVTSEIEDSVEEGQTRPPSVSTAMKGQASTIPGSDREASAKQKKAQADSANGLKAMTTLFALAVSRACLLH
jgi:hypothetical protein